MISPGTQLDWALKLAAAGYQVFPCEVRGKRPAVKGWQQWATTDAAKIRGHWQRHSDHNVAIFTGRYGRGGLLAVDVDEKGKAGGARLRELEQAGCALPPTFIQQTPTGGRHLVFSVPSAVKQGADVLAPGLDIRSQGGYIVAAGSVTDRGAYTTPAIVAPAPAPAWLIDRCGRATERPTEKAAPPPNVDPERADSRVTRYLKEDAPPAIEGEAGDETTYRVACRVKDLGVDEATALALMRDIWNPKCQPPWDPAELQKKIENAYQYGREPQGAASPEADFSDDTLRASVFEDPEPAKPATKSKLFFELFASVTPALERPALVEGLLDHGAMSVLYGESNTGKTFVALDIAFHVAAGRQWNSRGVEQGAAIYVAAEGGGQIRKRFAALRVHYEASAAVPLALVPCPIDLSGAGADVESLLALITAVEREAGRPAVLVIIDTLARALGGANENAPDDMGAFVRNVDRIRSATKSHLLIVHHSGKDKARGARGHSSLRAATDTELEVADKTVTATKQRDMELGGPIGFELLPVEIGRDRIGRRVTSCVVTPRSVEAADEFGAKAVKADSVAGRALETLGNLTLSGRKIDLPAWRAEFIGRHYAGKNKAGWNAFDRAVSTLTAANRIVREGDYARPA